VTVIVSDLSEAKFIESVIPPAPDEVAELPLDEVDRVEEGEPVVRVLHHPMRVKVLDAVRFSYL
jgi:hypothetical protein